MGGCHRRPETPTRTTSPEADRSGWSAPSTRSPTTQCAGRPAGCPAGPAPTWSPTCALNAEGLAGALHGVHRRASRRRCTPRRRRATATSRSWPRPRPAELRDRLLGATTELRRRARRGARRRLGGPASSGSPAAATFRAAPSRACGCARWRSTTPTSTPATPPPTGRPTSRPPSWTRWPSGTPRTAPFTRAGHRPRPDRGAFGEGGRGHGVAARPPTWPGG